MLQSLKQWWASYSPYVYCATLVGAILILAIMGSRDNIKVGLTESEQHAAVALQYKAEADSFMTLYVEQKAVVDSMVKVFTNHETEITATETAIKQIEKQTKTNVAKELSATDSVAYSNLHARAKRSKFYTDGSSGGKR